MNGTGRCCPNSYDSMLPSSRMMQLDSSLNFKEFSGFPRSSRIDFVCEPIHHFPLLLFVFTIRSTSFKITSWATPSILRSTLKSGSSISTGDSVLRSSFLALRSSGLSVGLPCSSLSALSAPVSWCEKTHSQRFLVAAAVAAAAIAKHSQAQSSVRDEASRVFQIKFVPLFEKSLSGCNLPAQSCIQLRHWTFICKNGNPLSCARAKSTQ